MIFKLKETKHTSGGCRRIKTKHKNICWGVQVNERAHCKGGKASVLNILLEEAKGRRRWSEYSKNRWKLEDGGNKEMRTYSRVELVIWLYLRQECNVL